MRAERCWPLVALAVVAGGCGSSGSTSSTAEQPPGTTLVAALGDSITSGSPGYDPSHDRAKLLGFGEDVKSQWEYWAQRADPSLRFRNCGVYGERTDEIALRLDACAKGAEVLVVQGGINDIAQGYPVYRRCRQSPGDGGSEGRSSGCGSRSRTSCPGTTAIRWPTRRSGN